MRKGLLPPGFRFHPTDVELVRYYLRRKVLGKKFFDAIADVDVYKFNPWELAERSHLRTGDLKLYFFCPREKKYTTGDRQKRATGFGFWKATGKDRAVRYEDQVVGMIKSLVFHTGKSPKGERTDWVMHEYRLEENGLAENGIVQDAFVLCVIFKKDGAGPKNGAQYGAPFNEDDWDDDDDEDAGVRGEVSFGDLSFLLPANQRSSILTSPNVPASVCNAASPSGHMAAACMPSGAVRNDSVSGETSQLVNVGEQVINGRTASSSAVVCEPASALLGYPSNGSSCIISSMSHTSETLPSTHRNLAIVFGADASCSDVYMPLTAVSNAVASCSDAHDLPLVISDGDAPCSNASGPRQIASDPCPPYVEAPQVELGDNVDILEMLAGFTDEHSKNEVFDCANPREAALNIYDDLEDLIPGGLVDEGQFLELMDLDGPLNLCAEQDPKLSVVEFDLLIP